MVAPRFLCNQDRLRLLLDEKLTEPEQTDAIEHIETCRSCRLQLEAMAAEPDWWRQASDFLRRDRDDAELLESAPPEISQSASSPGLSKVEFSCGFLDPSDNPAMLGRLGDYEILEVIGRGGMGVVLKGYDGELNRHVALKVLAPHLASSAAARRRFAREAQAAAAVAHLHVVAIHAVEPSGRLPYLVMPLVAGESLQQRIDRSGPLGIREALRIGMQAAQGLAAAHAQGLVHRDVKPANILLERGVDRVLLTDFGLARAADDASLTRSGVIPGTPQYMSPEQAKGESADHRSDLFSLGSVLYAVCTGHPPFRAETTMGVLRRICDDDPRPIRQINPDVPEWLAGIIERLHAKQPSQRFQSAAEMAELLEQCLAHVQQPTVVALPASLTQKMRRDARKRRPWLRTAVVVTALAMSALAATEMLGLTHMTRSLLVGANADTEPAAQALNSSDTEDRSAARQPAATAPPAVEPLDMGWNDGVAEELLQINYEISVLEERATQ